VDVNANEVDLIMGRNAGKEEFAAKFINGRIVPLKAALSANEALKKEECDYLYSSILDSCQRERGQSCRKVLLAGRPRLAGW